MFNLVLGQFITSKSTQRSVSLMAMENVNALVGLGLRWTGVKNTAVQSRKKIFSRFLQAELCRIVNFVCLFSLITDANSYDNVKRRNIYFH